ncbi:MAG: hypothetical protein QUU85_16120, partial [Candidatus Eisenbacteria bacterium]|nr:hypothetical protein [Candidatus Eisenbacteria bacterium]
SEILVTPGDASILRGASLPVRARLVGLEGAPALFYRTGGSAWSRLPMQADVGTEFLATLADVQAETEYMVSLDRHRSRTYRVAVQEPYRATGYEKRIRFPDYTGLAPEKELSPHASITALKGSDAQLLVAVSRPDARGRLRFDSGRTIPLEAGEEGVLSAKVPVREADQFRVELSGSDGGAERSAAWTSESFRIDPIPDRMPSLFLVGPGEQVDLPPEMRVVVEADCADDFGIRKLDLVYHRNDQPSSRISLTRWQSETEARVAYPWNLEEIALTPGDEIRYHLELTDNDAVSGPKTTVSPEYSIRFPTLEQMYAQQEQERHEGLEDLRESLDKQVDLRKELEDMSREMRRDQAIDWDQKNEMEQFLQKQEEILQKMDQMATAMDRQMDRMQQGQLFSPEIVEKIARIQEMMREIQSPEFHNMLEQMREAMRSLDPKEVQKALEKMKLTQQAIEQGLDRTIAMLEKMLAEEKLDEAIRRAEQLAKEQEQLNQQAGTPQDSSKPDSTASMSPEEAQKLAEQQGALQKELAELRKQMEELSKLAEKSHPQMEQNLESPQGQQAQQALQSASEEMQSGKMCMGKNNRRGAMRSGKKAKSQIQQFADQMRQMQQQMNQSMTDELSRKLLALAGDLVDLSKSQESLVEGAAQKSTRDLAVEQNRIERSVSDVVSEIYAIARQTPFITGAQAKMLGEILQKLGDATNAFETGQRTGGVTLGRQTGTSIDMAVASLLESNQSMCSSSSSCNNPNPMQQMQGLTSQQQGLNQETQDAMSQMQGGRLPQDGSGRMEQLAARQMQIRAGLQDLAQSMQDRKDVLGRLGDLGEEMEDVVKEMREKNVDPRILDRQEKILSRLLTAQRSVRRQDFEEQRRSRTGIDAENPISPPPVSSTLTAAERLRRGILKGSQDPIPGDFRRIVDEYFRALQEGGGQ